MELPLIPYSAETDHMFVLNLDGSLAPAYDVGKPCDCYACHWRAQAVERGYRSLLWSGKWEANEHE